MTASWPERRMEPEEAESSGLVAVLQLHRGELLRFLAARCGDAAEAEDHLQELWLKAARYSNGPIADARAYGDTPAEKNAYEQNAKAQVTIWGGRGHLGDYASKAWAGMYADYYLPRWTRYLTEARAAALAKRPVDDAAFTARLLDWEKNWVASPRTYKASPPADPVAEARALMMETAR